MTRLDELISENAKPSFILDFVGAAADIRRLFSESLFFQRIFQLDFFLSCGRPDIDKLFKLAKFLPARDRSLLAFQILLSESDKAQYAKYKYRRVLKEMSSSFGAFNPYVYLYGDTADRIRYFDKVCFKTVAAGNITDLHRVMPKEAFTFFMEHIGYSLFQNRLAQVDFLSGLPPSAQDALVKGIITSMTPRYYMRFVRSVFASDLELRLKTAILGGMKESKLKFCTKGGRLYADLISECSSFQELVLKDCISGADELGETFAMHLLLYMPENLRAWLDANQRFPSYLRREDVDELVSYSVSHGGSNAADA